MSAKEAKAEKPKATVAEVRRLVDELRAENAKNPGDGVLGHHLTALASNLESLEQVERWKKQQARLPEDEDRALKQANNA